MRFEAELEDHLTRREAERTLRAVTVGGRYAELFARVIGETMRLLVLDMPPETYAAVIPQAIAAVQEEHRDGP